MYQYYTFRGFVFLPISDNPHAFFKTSQKVKQKKPGRRFLRSLLELRIPADWLKLQGPQEDGSNKASSVDSLEGIFDVTLGFMKR